MLLDYSVLYDLGFRFKKTKLWKRLWDSDVFAVKLDDGEIAYVSVMGKAGTYCGIGVYVGDEGYRSYKNLSTFDYDLVESEFEMAELAVSQCCYHLALDSKEDLEPEELEDIRAYARKHKIRLAGKNAYPHPQKFEPECFPWHLASEKEISYITQAARATLRINELLKNSSPEEIGLRTKEVPPAHFLVMELVDGQYEITGQMDAPELKPVALTRPASLNEIALRSLKRCRTRATFECELIIWPTPVRLEEEDSAPFYPYVLLTAKSNDHYMLPPEPVHHYKDHPEDMVNHFIDMLIEHEMRPDKLLVRDERTYAMLELLAKKLSIPIKIQESLPALDDAEDSIMDYLNGYDVTEEEAAREIMDFIDMLLSLDKSEAREIPQELLTQLKLIVDEGVLPEDTARKLKDKFHL